MLALGRILVVCSFMPTLSTRPKLRNFRIGYGEDLNGPQTRSEELIFGCVKKGTLLIT